MKRRRLLLPPALLALLCAPLHGQGPLTPPGSPAPAMKSLDQIEARTPVQSLTGDGTSLHIISQSGSYYLTGNIAAPSGKIAISVANGVSGVTIDLNGFTLTGTAGGVTAIKALQTTSIAISNGVITDFSGLGISLGNASRARLDNLTFAACNGGGLSAGGYAIVKNCNFQLCGSATASSLLVQSESIVDHCVVVGNPGGDGIQVDYGTIVSNCTVGENAGSGIVTKGSFVRFINDSSFKNGIDGIDAADCSDVTECTCISNGSTTNAATSAGIHETGKNARIDRCFATKNAGRGIAVDSASALNLVTRNSSVGNLGANYIIPSGNRPAVIVSYGVSTGYTSSDPLANTQ